MNDSTVRRTRDDAMWKRDALLVGGLSVAAAVLRLLFLGRRSLWYDEALSVEFARLPWLQLLAFVFRYEIFHVAPYLVLHPWLTLGESEFNVRLLSAIFGIAAVPLIFILGRRLFSARAGLIAALLLAVNASAVYYSQEARGYSLVMFLVMVSSLCLLRSLDRPDFQNLLAFVATSVLAVYTHLLAALVLAAQGLFALLLKPRNVSWPRWIVTGLAIAVLLVPIGISLLVEGIPKTDWIPPTTFQTLQTLLPFFAGAIRDGSPASWLVEALYFFALARALYEFVRAWAKSRTIPRKYAFVIVCLVVPLALAIAASFARPLLVPRFLLICLPFFILLTAAGVSTLRPKAPLALALIAFLGIGLHQSIVSYSVLQNEDWRDATSYVLAHAEPLDAVMICPGYLRIPFDYYRRLEGDHAAYPVVVFPSGPDFQGPANDPERKWLAALFPRYRRVWVILSQPYFSDEDRDFVHLLRSRLPENYGVATQRSFLGIDVLFYGEKARSPAPPASHGLTGHSGACRAQLPVGYYFLSA